MSRTQNSSGTVKGARNWVAITMLIEREIFPFARSAMTGDATPAGIAVRRSIPTARSASKTNIEK